MTGQTDEKNEKGWPRLRLRTVAGLWAAAPALQVCLRRLRGARPPQTVGGEHAVGGPEAGLAVITATLTIAGVAWPGTFAWCGVGEFKGPARNVWAPWPPPRCRGHGGQLRLPPPPHFTFGSISFSPIGKGPGYTKQSSCAVP